MQYTNNAISGVNGIGAITLSSATLGYVTSPQVQVTYQGDVHLDGGGTSEFLLFQSLSDFSLDLVNTQIFSAPTITFGFADRGGLCFFAGGLAPTVPTGTIIYGGTADGLAQSATTTGRLLRSSVDLTMNFTARTGTLSVVLKTVPNLFGTNAGQAQTTIGTLTANLALTGTQVTASSVAGPPGYTGTVQGELTGSTGIALTFRLSNAAGDVIWGVVAADGSPGFGAWDY